MNIGQTQAFLEREETGNLFGKLYGKENIPAQRARYINLIRQYEKAFGDAQISLFSSPGRTEICGNHTDHNYGKVLAASINLDCICAASRNGDNVIRISDITYREAFSVDLSNLEKIPGERGSVGLIKGIAKALKDFGFKIGGFNACVTSSVIRAAGVSSSASFEMLICSVLNAFYNDGKIDTVTYARSGQYAENVYWDKASGLLDQMACAVGGMISIDFEDPSKPIVEKIDFDFAKQGYNLVIVNTGKSHADLNADYSSVPTEMKSVAKALGHDVCRRITVADIEKDLPSLREKVGDRAVLRALHFLTENKRVEEQIQALKNGDFDAFLRIVTASGNSSWKWLQNCYSPANCREQGITVALAFTEMYLAKIGVGACRVHGGGFAGVIAVFLPCEKADEYISYIEGLLGKGNAYKMSIRGYGAVCLNDIH